ncbi:MAG: hypothetical protein ACP5U2_15225 [Bryobacteraceae bacterium]
MSRTPRLSRRHFLLLGWFSRRRIQTLAGIRFELLRNGSPLRKFVLIHGDEATARRVLLARMKTGRPGWAYLVTHEERLVRLGALRFDPNRILSSEGAERNLRHLNPGASEADLRLALAFFDREREKLARALLPEPGRLLVALHNNQQGYSVHTEIPISDRVALHEPAQPHDFYLCTDPRDFERLATSPFNVVLQHSPPPPDDGSLSRLAARRGLRYVNIETQLGAEDKQRRMLAWLEDHL